MRKCSANIIKSIIAGFDKGGINYIESLGIKTETISQGVSKFISSDPNIQHFILFEIEGAYTELSFLFADCALMFSDVEDEFGKFDVHYNFRDNFSEFKANISSVAVADLYFVKDNKFEISADRRVIETDPYGKGASYSALEFTGFCLRLNSI
ncbi:MAG TPA: hypothetical protein VIF60_19360 [Burkholderiaceae bacterium]|jgi:hypothetical protein